MKSIKYAIYAGIALHFIRLCLRKSLTQEIRPTIDLSKEKGGRKAIPECLRPMYDSTVEEIDRAILREIVGQAKSRNSLGIGNALRAIHSGRMLKGIQRKLEDSINVGYMEVTSVDTSHDKDGNVIAKVDVNAMMPRPVEYVEMKVSV